MNEFEQGRVVAGRYEIIRTVGRGGMSVVYLARDLEAGRNVALKTLLPKYMKHAVALKRFIREIKAIRQLDHPCVVKIYEADEVDDQLYFTMEYVNGKSVRQMLARRSRLGMGSTVRILSLICHALQHIHKFTLHRDISPENVMVKRDGAVKLLDFGLAKLVTDSSSITQAGTGLGKEQYCAPEQLEDAAQVGHRADLYSVGVMFYEMLSGRLPTSDSARLTTRVSGLPPEVDSFLTRAIAKDPAKRFDSAREMRHQLARLYEITEEIKLQPGDEEVTAAIDTPLVVAKDTEGEISKDPQSISTPVFDDAADDAPSSVASSQVVTPLLDTEQEPDAPAPADQIKTPVL